MSTRAAMIAIDRADRVAELEAELQWCRDLVKQAVHLLHAALRERDIARAAARELRAERAREHQEAAA